MKKYLLILSSLTLVASLALAPVTTLAEEILEEDLTEEVFDWVEEDSNLDPYFEDIPEEPTEEVTDEESLDMHMARGARPEEDDEEEEDNVEEEEPAILILKVTFPNGEPVGPGFLFRLKYSGQEAETDENGCIRFEIDVEDLPYGSEYIQFI
ncbi:hypothetical protein ACWOBE_04995 [Hutsoniella sourekii]